MSIEADIITHMLAVSGIAALVSDRIQPLRLDQNSALPGITLNRIGTTPQHRQEGKAQEFETRIQFDIWATSYKSAKAVASQVRLALDGFRGTMGSSRVDSVRFLDEIDDFEPENENVRVIQDFDFYHVG